MKKILTLLLLCGGLASGQIFSSSVTRRLVTGGTLPASCSVGQVWYKTGTSAGQYNCSAANTWTLLSAGAGIAVMSTGAGAPSAACAVPSASNLALYWDTTNRSIYYCSNNTGPVWRRLGDDGNGSGKSGGTQWAGVTSGGAGFTVNDVAGTSILYILPAANGAAGQVMYDTGAATCPTLETAPTSCHQLAWTAYTVTGTVFSGSQALATGALGANACATTIDVAATGVTSTDVAHLTANADWSTVTGYGAASTDGLLLYVWPTTGYVHIKQCNGTGTSITPGAATVNIKVTR